jgi:hypothetical protein
MADILPFTLTGNRVERRLQSSDDRMASADRHLNSANSCLVRSGQRLMESKRRLRGAAAPGDPWPPAIVGRVYWRWTDG